MDCSKSVGFATHADYNRIPFHLRHTVASAVPNTLSARLAEDDVRRWLESNPVPKLPLPDAYQVKGKQ